MTSRPKFDSRKLMEMAVDVMKKSVCEPRNDGKACPLVGAVLYKPDGTVETACRGELRNGDHAEFTLLERKNRSCSLDGSILFATLEPCAPGSRNEPKLSCAERIVAARVKEVWVGLEDPDPMVDRKGIKHLQDSGIAVQMFDRDLQEVIRGANEDFIAQALERAEQAEKEPIPPTLSRFEDPVATAGLQDFSPEALGTYQVAAKIEGPIDAPAFRRRLIQQGLLKQEGDRVTPTGFGLLLFGKEPRITMPQAGLLATIHYPGGREETRDFEGPMVFIPDLVERWLTDKLPNVIDRSRMQRREEPALPFELVREAVVNALVHRDYDIAGAKCQLVVTEDTIVVKSPGGPLAPITLEQLQSFTAPMLSRNPQAHYVFARMELAEERGLGMKSLKSRPLELGLPQPRYAWEDPYLVLTLYRNVEGATRGVADEILGRFSPEELEVFRFLASKGGVTRRELAERFGINDRTAQRRLSSLIEIGLVRRVGQGPTTRYELARL